LFKSNLLNPLIFDDFITKAAFAWPPLYGPDYYQQLGPFGWLWRKEKCFTPQGSFKCLARVHSCGG
jgi:hypothetical protein